MNKDRRTKLKNILNEIETINSRVEDVMFEEETAFESIPENLQGSLRYDEMEENIEKLSSISNSLEEIINLIEELIS